jgi:hypothetical protein
MDSGKAENRILLAFWSSYSWGAVAYIIIE